MKQIKTLSDARKEYAYLQDTPEARALNVNLMWQLIEFWRQHAADTHVALRVVVARIEADYAGFDAMREWQLAHKAVALETGRRPYTELRQAVRMLLDKFADTVGEGEAGWDAITAARDALAAADAFDRA